LSVQVRQVWLPAIFYRSWGIRVTFMKPGQNPVVSYDGGYRDTGCRMTSLPLKSNGLKRRV
jgi:hypothetical protein